MLEKRMVRAQHGLVREFAPSCEASDAEAAGGLVAYLVGIIADVGMCAG